MHNDIEKNIITVDINIGILDIHGHFAQKRGYGSSSDIEINISVCERQFAIDIAYLEHITYLEDIEVKHLDFFTDINITDFYLFISNIFDTHRLRQQLRH